MVRVGLSFHVLKNKVKGEHLPVLSNMTFDIPNILLYFDEQDDDKTSSRSIQKLESIQEYFSSISKD